MSSESPAVILYNSLGIELSVQNGVAIPASTSGILIDGYDGTNSRLIAVDTSGRLEIVGPATAGATPAGNPLYVGGQVTTSAPTYSNNTVNVLSLDTSGNLRVTGSGTAGSPGTEVLTVQGISGGTALPVSISGTVTVTNAANGSIGTAAPSTATYVGALVTTAAESGLTSGDMYALNLTTTGQLRIDGVYPLATAVGTAVDMAQVGGVVTTAVPTYSNNTVNALSLDGYGNLRVTGSGTAGSPNAGVLTVQGISGGTALPVSVSGTITTTNAANGSIGAAAPSTATYMGALVTTAAESGLTSGDMYALNLTTTGQLRIDGVYPLATAVATAVDMAQVGGVVTTSAPTYTTATVNALSLDTSGNLRVTGSGTAGSPGTEVLTVQGVSGGTAIPVSGSLTIDKSTTGTMTTVASATSSTTILVSNANRVGAGIYNDGSSSMYLALSATAASLTAFTIRILPNSYYDLPVTYTGQINAIWNGTASNARVTEWT